MSNGSRHFGSESSRVISFHGSKSSRERKFHNSFFIPSTHRVLCVHTCKVRQSFQHNTNVSVCLIDYIGISHHDRHLNMQLYRISNHIGVNVVGYAST